MANAARCGVITMLTDTTHTSAVTMGDPPKAPDGIDYIGCLLVFLCMVIASMYIISMSLGVV